MQTNETSEPALTKVLIVLPAYDGTVKTETFLSLLNFARQSRDLGIEATFTAINGDGAIGRVRNNAAHYLLEHSDHEYLMQIDHDIRFTPEDLARLVSHKVDVVGGMYAVKQLEDRWIMTGLEGEATDDRGLLSVREIGTGFLLISRRCLEKLRADNPDITYRCDGDPAAPTKWDFFKFGVVDNRYLSEDYYFCLLARRAGFKVYADTEVRLQHIGAIAYPVLPTVRAMIAKENEEKAAASTP